jgi:O-acetyl-ADP-ribose deacetylase (regulator of RNase III)
MPTEHLKGDIFEDAAGAGSLRAFAFGADCDGTMDEGIAVAFKKRWPAFAAAFAAAHVEPGSVFAWREGEVAVYALGLRAGKKPKVATLERAVRAMVEQAQKDGAKRVAIPRLGGGKSGLDATRVKRVLDEIGGGTEVALVVYEQFIRKKPEAG